MTDSSAFPSRNSVRLVGVQTGVYGVRSLEEVVTQALAGRYTVRRLLGTGGMGSVFLADDLTLDRAVAIKVLPLELANDERLVQRFQREAKTAARLDHPNIVPIYRVEQEGPLNYLVMKYIPGRSLETILAEGTVPINFAYRVVCEAAAALQHAHQKGIVHRDVKPANIVLDTDKRVVLMDFGISKTDETTSQLTQTGVIVGTPSYMAPEQALGRPVDGRADQYALAVLAYQMLAGLLPFSGENAHAVLYQQIHEAAPPLNAYRPDVPAPLVSAIARAMSKDPKDRFPEMEMFAQALSTEAAVTRPNPVVNVRPRRRRVIGFLAGLAALAIIALVAQRAMRVSPSHAQAADTATHRATVPPATGPDSSVATVEPIDSISPVIPLQTPELTLTVAPTPPRIVTVRVDSLALAPVGPPMKLIPLAHPWLAARIRYWKMVEAGQRAAANHP